MSYDIMYKKLTITMGTPSIEAAPDLVMGREEDQRRLWKNLEAGSLRLLSERRMGKTWLLRLAIARKPDWALPLMMDAEGFGSAADFVLDLNRQLHAEGIIDDGRFEKTSNWFRRVLGRVQGEKVAGIEIPEIDPWYSLLEDTCKRFVEGSNIRKAVLIIDELPFFLDKLMKANLRGDAIRILDMLRRLRQDLPSLRMVFCGSLGLHVVLQRLAELGYTGRPLNDMPPFEVLPLDRKNARYLAGCLLTGEEIACGSLDACAAAVGEEACGVPFYIQHFVKWMRECGTKQWTPRQVRQIPEDLFVAHGDPADFIYYDGRLDEYYPEDVVELARTTLDVISRNEKGASFDTILNLVRHSPKTLTVDGSALLKILGTLRDDHYLVQKKNAWKFKLDLIRRWWFKHRGEMGL